jgi:hypothetical protein
MKNKVRYSQGEISVSRGVEYEDGCLLGCCTVGCQGPDDGGSKHF